MKQTVKPHIALLIVCFLEGASLMAWELLSVKLAAPYFGATVYMWAAALGITLTGIAVGYFIGGRLSRSAAYARYTFIILLASSVYSFLVPFLSESVMNAIVGSAGLMSGPLVSMLVFLPLIAMFGAVSPLLIQNLASSNAEPGRAGGWVYGVSTLGGIAGTLFTGLYAIRSLGVKETCMAFASVMVVAAMIFLVASNRGASR